MIKDLELLSHKNHSNNQHLTCEQIIELQRSVPTCSIMTEGYHPIWKTFYFCLCDPNCQSPLCETCIRTCHKVHWIGKFFDEIIAEERTALCHCGQSNHIIIEEKEHLSSYLDKCWFMEWSKTSKRYIYYENFDTEKICMFCYNQCMHKSADYIQKIYDKKSSNIDSFPVCSCKHEDFNRVLDNFVKIFYSFAFEDFSINHFIQVVMLSEESFKNAFYNIKDVMIKFQDELFSWTFEIDSYWNNVHFIKVIEKLGYMWTNCKEWFYFKKCAINITKSIFYILCKNFQTNSAMNWWTFKKYYFILYHRFYFRVEFEELPILTEKDIMNLTPWQRMMFCDYIDKFSGKEEFFNFKNEYSAESKTIVDDCLNWIEKYKVIKQKNEFVYEILRKVYSELKRAIRYNQITKEQSTKFFALNDEIIYSSINAGDITQRSEMSQWGMLNQMVKCVLYISIYYNDCLVKEYLRNEIPWQRLLFFHCDNEIAKMIYKNTAHILWYCRTISDMETKFFNAAMTTQINFKQTGIKTWMPTRWSNKFKDYSEEIMFTASSINSWTLNYPDFYLLGLRRILNKEQELCFKYINNSLTDKEFYMVEELHSKYWELEDLYNSFFSFETNAENFQWKVIKIIGNVFDILDVNDYCIPDIFKERDINAPVKLKKMKFNLQRVTIHKSWFNEENIKEKHIMRRIWINKVPIMFTIIKSLRIWIKCTKNDDNNKTINQSYFDSLYKFLFFYTTNNPENILLFLTSHNTRAFMHLPISNWTKLLGLWILCLNTWYKKDVAIYNFENLFKWLSNIAERVSNKPQHINLFDDVLRVLSKWAKLNYQNHENILNKLRKFIKKIYSHNRILEEFTNMLLNTSQTNKSLVQMIKNKEMLSGYPISILTRIFKNFLKIINKLFNDNTTWNEFDFWNSILSKSAISQIIQDKTLYFPFRIELLKFFRIAHINMMVEVTKLKDYIGILATDITNPANEQNANFEFFHNWLKIKDSQLNILLEINVLWYELKNFEKITSKETTDKRKVYNYFEEGIILPWYVFINKFMAIISTLDKSHYQKWHEVTLYFLELKKKLYEKNTKNSENQSTLSFSALFKNWVTNQKNKFSIIFEKMGESAWEEINQDIKTLKDPNFDTMNYKKIYSFFDKHSKDFIKSPPSRYWKDWFQKKSIMYSEDDILKKEEEYRRSGKICTEFSEKILPMLAKYSNDKLEFEDSSLHKNWNEKNILFDATYRSIVLRPMFYLINNPKLYFKYRRQNLWHIFRLWQYDTGDTQADILNLYRSEKGSLSFNQTINIEHLCTLIVNNYLSILFSSCNPNSTSTIEDYTIAYMVIKIWKYMCEDHNTKFQSLFFQEIKWHYTSYGAENPDEKTCSLNIFELMMCTLNKVVLLAKWDKVTFDFDEDNISYFYEIFFVMIELSIEMIQGTVKGNLEKIINIKGRENENSLWYKFLSGVKDIITNDDNNSEIIYNARLDILNFIVAFWEEKKTPEKLINLIAVLFNPLTVFNSIVNTLKKLYIKNYKSSVDIRSYNTIEFNKRMYQFFKQKYNKDSDFSESKEFELCNRMYTYVKLLRNFNNKDAKRLIDSIENYNEADWEEIEKKQDWSKGEDDENVMIDQNFTQNFYAVKFFENITRTVWIQGEEKNPQKVIFTLNPTVLFLSEDTKINFYQTVPRDNRSSKWFALMEYCNYFFLEINHNKKRLSGDWFKKQLNNLNYAIVEKMMFSIIVIINIIMFCWTTNTDSLNNYEDINKIIMPLGIWEVVLNVICLGFWLISKFSLYYVIEKVKYITHAKRNIEEEPLTIFEYLEIIFFNTLLSRQEIISFSWNIIFSLSAVCNSNNIFLYAIQWLIIVNISPTLQNIAKAITLRYKQLLVTLLFLFVALYIFACLAFYFLASDFIKIWQNNQENTCGSLWYCFWTQSNFGLRTDGGIGEFIEKTSFIYESSYFMGMFFFQLVFFVIIIIIMLAVIGGSIIDTFAELSDKSLSDFIDMNTVCFICNGDKNNIERNGEKFEEHVNNVHNVWTYVDYMIGWKFVDPQETNAINSFVIEKIEEKKISWFPSFSSNEDDDEEDEGDNDDED